MRIFGRKANQEPTKENVPPELKPYFNSRPFWARLGNVLPLAVAVVLAAGIIGGALWVRNHRMSQTNQQAQVNQQAQSSTNGNSTPQTSANKPKEPGSTTGQTPSASASSTSQNQQLLNTGPGETAFIVAAAVAATGMAASYVRQRFGAAKQ